MRPSATRFSSARIHATAGCRERFGAALGVDGIAVQEPSYTDLEDLATLLQHAAAVVTNAGTILLDAIVNDRPTVCVLWDEGAPAGRALRRPEPRRRPLPAARRPRARSSARTTSTSSWPGSTRRSRSLSSLDDERERIAAELVGDGRRQSGRAGRRGDLRRAAARMTTLVLYSRLAFYPVHWLALSRRSSGATRRRPSCSPQRRRPTCRPSIRRTAPR